MNKFYIYIMVCVALVFSACSDSDDDATADGGQMPAYTESGLLVEVTDTIADAPDVFINRLSNEPFFQYMKTSLSSLSGSFPLVESLFNLRRSIDVPALDALFAKEVGVDVMYGRRWQIESYAFNYKTKNVQGEDVVLSARVTFPNNTVQSVEHPVQTLSLYAHQFLPDPAWAPSLSMMLMPLRALYNSAVIEPDFQGNGATFGKMVYCALAPEVLARQEADCMLAALDIMHRRGVYLAPDGYTTSWGCSLASAVPVAFAKWYETQAQESFRQQVRLSSSFTGEGVVDYAAYFEWLCKEPDFDARVLVQFFPEIASFSKEQLGGYDAKEFFADWVNELQVTVGGKTMSYFTAATMGLAVSQNFEGMPDIYRLKVAMAPDMLGEDGKIDLNAPKTKALLNAMRMFGDVYNWTPVKPLYLASCKEDEVQPYDLVKDSYKVLSANGTNPNMHWVDSHILTEQQSIKDAGMSNHLQASLLMMIYMASMKEPADLANFYLLEKKY